MNNLIKKNAIDKLIMLASNGKLDKNDFTIEEKYYLINCINLFQFLISYPEVKDEKTFDLLSRS